MRRENHDIQFRLPKNKKWMKQELQRIAEENGLHLSQLLTMILTSWLRRKRGKKVFWVFDFQSFFSLLILSIRRWTSLWSVSISVALMIRSLFS